MNNENSVSVDTVEEIQTATAVTQHENEPTPTTVGDFGVQEINNENLEENAVENTIETNESNADLSTEESAEENGGEIADLSTEENVEASEQAESVEASEQGESVETIEENLTEDEKLERELEAVNKELADLEVTIEKGEVNVVVENFFDTQEGADEVGIGFETDDYNREIIEDVFENRLRMSVNDIKLAYSKMKNTILSYKNTKQRYNGVAEYFFVERKPVAQFEIAPECLKIYVKYDGEIADIPFLKKSSDKVHKDMTAVMMVKRGQKDKRYAPIDKAIELIDSILTSAGTVKKKVYVPVAYAERYPLNPYAVIRGKEGIAPVEKEYDGVEYDPIEHELTRNIIEELLGEDFDVDKKKGRAKLEALRQQATTIKGSVALTEPIVYFYDACQNGDSTINYLNVQQVLNDKFLGKLLPPQYVAIAENSERSEELNLFAIEKVLEDIKENEKYNFCLAISCRTFARKHSHEKLVKLLSNNDCSRLILAFDAGMLAALGKKGIEGLDEIRSLGAKVMIDVGVDFGLDLLTDYAMDYLRLDARYYRENDARRTAILDMITGYTTVQGITTVMSGVEDNKESKHYVMHDIDVIQGFASSEPDRNIPHAVKYMKKLPLVAKEK